MINDNQVGAIQLGDEGYGLTPWVMTPVRNAQTTVEKKYNKLHTRERVLIERMFRQLKRKVILAYCVLHNVAKHLKDEDFPYITEDKLETDYVEVPEPSDELKFIFKRGKARRNHIATVIQGFNL